MLERSSCSGARPAGTESSSYEGDRRLRPKTAFLLCPGVPNRPIKAEQSDYNGKQPRERPRPPTVIVPATTQTPKAIIPAEIRNESAVSIIGPPFFIDCRTSPTTRWGRRAARRWGRWARWIEASGPRRAKIGTPYGGLRRPIGRDLRPTNATSQSCGVCVARERFNASRRRSERRRGAVSDQAGHDAGQTGARWPGSTSRWRYGPRTRKSRPWDLAIR
jgi:hypothetical protein